VAADNGIRAMTSENLAFALNAAKKSLAEQKRAVFCERINAAFEHYLARREDESQRPRASHKNIAKQLDSIAKKAASLAKAAGFADKPSEREKIARSRLEQIANVHAKEIGGYPGLDPVVAKYGAPRMNYRGDERLSLMFGELKFLEQLARRAHKGELMRVRKTGRPPDWTRDGLIHDITNAWQEAFELKGWPDASDGGPYARFIRKLATLLPKESSLAKAMNLTPDALREVVRAGRGKEGIK
jgi:hypothetical protein